MLQAKTHFQQLPLEMVKKILEEESRKSDPAIPAARPARTLVGTADESEKTPNLVNQKTGEKLFVKLAAQNDEPNPYNVRYPAWERVYLGVLREEDPQELAKKVSAAEAAIIERLQDLGGSPDGTAERIAIKEASDALLSIKTRKLNFPDWRAHS